MLMKCQFFITLINLRWNFILKIYNYAMNLEILQNKKQECRTWKNVEPWFLQLQEASKIEKSNLEIDYGDWFSVGKKEDLTSEEFEVIEKTAKKLIPWRKGPFKIFGLEIDSEWQSNIKYNLIRPHFNLKDKVEGIVMSFAKQNYAFNFDVLFYDVTTLYFETFKEDELRRNGFSKDNKSQQPQILVALMVTKEGFPISYEIFPGNTFEGHTIIPVVKKIINKYEVKEFTIVADAAMISAENVKQLVANRINYIVGARLGNISDELLEKITKANLKQDGKSIRIKTENGYLICSYSSVRYRKDKYEMEKQIERAKQIVENPAKNKKLKFTKAVGEKIELNKRLIDKHTKLLGIKGYYTNLEEKVADNSTIINRYHELYRIEQAFRISKNDLETRPVFHFKEEPIKLHLLICFMALVLSKHIELKSNQSIRFFIDELKKVTDARIYNHLSRKEIRMRAKISKPVSEILSKLNLSY